MSIRNECVTCSTSSRSADCVLQASLSTQSDTLVTDEQSTVNSDGLYQMSRNQLRPDSIDLSHCRNRVREGELEVNIELRTPVTLVTVILRMLG